MVLSRVVSEEFNVEKCLNLEIRIKATTKARSAAMPGRSQTDCFVSKISGTSPKESDHDNKQIWENVSSEPAHPDRISFWRNSVLAAEAR